MDWAIIKIELIKQSRWYGHDFSLEHLEYILVTLSLITPIETKKNDNLTKKIIILNRVKLSLR